MIAEEKHITLRDIARRVNLSVAAVSFSLRNDASIPAKTRSRVAKMAVAMNYRPDPVMSALAAYRSRIRSTRNFSVLALVSNWSTAEEWIHRPSARELIAGANERARTLGYSIQHFWAREKGMSPNRLGDVLFARGIRGIILAPFESPSDRLELDWEKFTAVAIEQPLHYPHLHHVVPNYFASMLLVWEKLRARGYTRIGLVVRKDLAERSSHQWEAAFGWIQTRLPAEDRIPPLVLEAGEAANEVVTWLRYQQPQAVINRSDVFFEAVRREGLEVPVNLGYVSLNVIDDQPGVSGIVQHRDIMGRAAVEVLHNLMHRHQQIHHVPQGTVVAGTWFQGTTLLPHAYAEAI